MKVAIITDTHAGCRNDLPVFLDFQEKFYQNVFFPKIDELGIKTVLHLGDVFDRRKYINYKTLFRLKSMYFDPLAQRGLWSPTIIGNHDIFHNNTLDVNALDLVVNEFHYSNVKIIREPQVVDIHGFKILMMPWICDENKERSFDILKSAPTDLCMGHFPISGFVMHKGQVSEDGLDRGVFDRYDMVFSGHFHHRSSDGRIYYLGNPFEMTWQDFNDKKGFHIFDLEKRTLQFIPNPYQMFYKIIYDDVAYTYQPNDDMSQYTNVYVKVVVVNKTNIKMYDAFMQNLYSHNPFNVGVVQNYSDIMEISENFVVDQSATTIQILHNFIDEVEIPKDLNQQQLKNDMTDIYNEALSLE